MKSGDIVIAPFPFSDLSDSKVRPALIISSDVFHKNHNVLLVAISTKKGIPELSLPLTQESLNMGTLNKASFVRFQNIFTLEKRMIIKKVGALSTETKNNVQQKLRQLID